MEEYKNWVYKILGIIFLIYICGECCSTLFSDGKLDQVDVQVGVKTHLRETLYDYDSYKSLSWSDFKERQFRIHLPLSHIHKVPL